MERRSWRPGRRWCRAERSWQWHANGGARGCYTHDEYVGCGCRHSRSSLRIVKRPQHPCAVPHCRLGFPESVRQGL